MTTKNRANQHAIWLIVLIAMIFSLTIGPIKVDALAIGNNNEEEDPGLYQLVCAATDCNGGLRLCSIVYIPSSIPGLDYKYPCFESSIILDESRL